MERVTMEAAVRSGKAEGKKMRKEGKVPAVVYGKETKSMPIEIKVKDIEKTVKTLSEGTLLITLKLTDKNNNQEKIVVIQEIQRDPVTDEIIHADFHQISETEKTTFRVPVFATGLAEGVKEGGTLEHIAREVKVRCLPKDLPNKFEIDVSAMKIGQDLKIKDIILPSGIELMVNPNDPLITCVAPHKEEEVKPADAAAAVAGTEPAQPELIKKERAAGEEGEEGAAAAPAADAKKEAKKEAKK